MEFDMITELTLLVRTTFETKDEKTYKERRDIIIRVMEDNGLHCTIEKEEEIPVDENTIIIYPDGEENSDLDGTQAD
jgi:hypothetical protein